MRPQGQAPSLLVAHPAGMPSLEGFPVFRPQQIRWVLLLSATVLALILPAGSASAAPGVEKLSGRQVGTAADVFTSDCDLNGDGTTSCRDLSVSVFGGRQTDQSGRVSPAHYLCVSSQAYVYSDETGEFLEVTYEDGCDSIAASSLTLGKRLSSVTLAQTEITLYEEVCDDHECSRSPSLQLVVAGTWTGVGPTTVSRIHGSLDDGDCRFAESGRMRARDAVFAGSIDGNPVGDVADAILTEGRFTFRSRCLAP